MMIPTPVTSSWRADVQGLRGAAVLLVVLYHVGTPLEGGFIGVDVFFVISGFVITRLLTESLESSGRINAAKFYARRIRRLIPALGLVLLVTSAASVLLPSPMGQPQETFKTALGGMLLSANLVIERSIGGYFSPRAETNPLLHTWSLSVEEQFYLAFPALLFVAWRLGRRKSRRAAVAAILVTAGISGGLLVAIRSGARLPIMGGTEEVFLFYSATARAWEFCAGALVALLPVRLSHRSSRMLLWAGLATVTISALAISPRTPFPGWATVPPVAGTAAIIVAGASRPPRNPLTWKPFTWTGDISYSWYLWHWPTIVFGREIFGTTPVVGVTAAALSIGPAVASYRWLEQPMRRSTRISTRMSYAMFAGVAVMVVGSVLGLLAFIQSGHGRPWSMEAHAAIQRGCDEQPVDYEDCTWNEGAISGSVFVVGDSESWALADGVIQAAQDLELSVTASSTNNCPFVDPVVAESEIPRRCVDSIRRDLARISETEPNLVVVANAESYANVIPDGLPGMVSAVENLGSTVVVVRQPPPGDEFSGRQSILVDLGEADRTVPREQRLLDFHQVEGTLVFDPAETLCNEQTCATARSGVEYYTNRNHLSVDGAVHLAPALRDILEAALEASGTR